MDSLSGPSTEASGAQPSSKTPQPPSQRSRHLLRHSTNIKTANPLSLWAEWALNLAGKDPGPVPQQPHQTNLYSSLQLLVQMDWVTLAIVLRAISQLATMPPEPRNWVAAKEWRTLDPATQASRSQTWDHPEMATQRHGVWDLVRLEVRTSTPFLALVH